MSGNVPANHVRLKRVYCEPDKEDGRRILVDRLWPRGVTKAKAALDDWIKEIAPSVALRQWFGHDPSRWVSFRTRYATELAEHPDLVTKLRDLAMKGPVTLVYSAKDEVHNDAVVLRDVILRR